MSRHPNWVNQRKKSAFIMKMDESDYLYFNTFKYVKVKKYKLFDDKFCQGVFSDVACITYICLVLAMRVAME